ncbi:toll/interleukin-1 receptor domain-containing protein [Flectobacillus sp. BAB-3569]|uniref:toll/interleukin-1 receptor domain-containing protein n=1 Tax=Flectobacillus sp. BAB-3569 TaxID=1509483 RepID=UPI000BA43BAD|nr:toll/interleukin-1 receptor domain-containing protein [Flectobacillus sp. BAB-3569]PAC33345.1 hypothetical protein BWI92_02220 [Flectobacillus sp. BAB-3569]
MKNGKIENIISFIALAVSIIGVFITNSKAETDIKYSQVVIGVIGSGVGMALSILFVILRKKKPSSTVFIAYSYNDKEIADKIANLLNDKHVRVIKEDEEIEIGFDIQKQIKEIIKNVDIVIILLSKDYYKSKNLKKVIELSKSLQKRILPITTDNSELPSNVANLKYFDTSEGIEKVTREIVDNIIHIA